MRLILFLFLISPSAFSQENKLVLGNCQNLCVFTDSSFVIKDSLPANLDSYSSIYIFSSSFSMLSPKQANIIYHFALNGGGLYLGAENWPLQAESNQLTKLIYNKEAYGEYQADSVESKSKNVNLKLSELDDVPPGNTTIAFPLDYRLKVEAWIEDQPLILSGKVGKGRIIIDGGYSRFYCDNWTEDVHAILLQFSQYLSCKIKK